MGSLNTVCGFLAWIKRLSLLLTVNMKHPGFNHPGCFMLIVYPILGLQLGALEAPERHQGEHDGQDSRGDHLREKHPRQGHA